MATNLFEDTNPRELKELLRQINAGDSALPDFQRDFVWDPNATQELIVSIAANYPAGSLLRIRNTHNLFASREFQGAPELRGRCTYLVLDGQQRLTSLYQAFYGVGDHRYFLDLRKLLEGADFEDAIFHLRATRGKAKRLKNFDDQAEALVLPLEVLRNGVGEFSKWSRKVSRRLPVGQERESLEDKLSELVETWIQTIDDYRFPVVTLSDSTDAEAVCTIFETLNRTGVKLSPFELLTARFWPRDVNLRQLWTAAQERHPTIAEFDVDPYYALQVVSLVSRAFPGCKRGDVLALEPSAIEEWWDRSVWGMGEGLKMLRDDCGVVTADWLPYTTITIPLAAVLAKLALSGTPEIGANRQKLSRWFWCSVLGQTYENAQNTQSAKDVTELLAWLGGGPAPESVERFRFDPNLLMDTTPRQRALYRGAMCLVLRNGSRDFFTADPMTGDVIRDHNVDDHHIFPFAYLGRLGVTDRRRDSLLNRTLIDRKTNTIISDKAPGDYLSAIEAPYLQDAKRGQKAFDELLRSHFLPKGSDSSLRKNDFDAFLIWRRDEIWREIRELTGASEESEVDLEELTA